MTIRHTPTTILAALTTAAVALAFAPAAGAATSDHNHDRIPDRWERSHRLSLHVNQARRDQDHDGMRNLAEWKAGMNPRKADSDADGVRDGAEDSGKVVSFVGGKLVIDLFHGDRVTAIVDADSEIHCKGMRTAARTASTGEDGGDEQDGRANDDGQDPAPGDDPAGHDDGQDDSHGDDHGRGHDDGQENDEHGELSCSTEALVAGALVHEAELRTTAAGLHVEELELTGVAAGRA